MRRSYRWVWALVGVLTFMFGAALGAGALVLASGPNAYGDDPGLDRLWESCERGSMGACDRLFWDAPLFSDYEEFGLTCGGRTDGGFDCTN
jgi:hypothetical protein